MTSKKLWRGLLVGLAAGALVGTAGIAFAGSSPPEITSTRRST